MRVVAAAGLRRLGVVEGQWELDGGGATMSQAVHVIDLLVAVMGEPVEVTARIATLAHERIDFKDGAVVTIVFASGALGVVRATTAAFPGVGAGLRVYGDPGSGSSSTTRSCTCTPRRRARSESLPRRGS